MDETLRKLWAATKLKLWPGNYYLLKFEVAAHGSVLERLKDKNSTFVVVALDELELSVTCHEERLEELKSITGYVNSSAPMRVITFDIALDFDVVGYMAVASKALAEAGISIIPQCAFSRDHILVPALSCDDAMQVLGELSAS